MFVRPLLVTALLIVFCFGPSGTCGEIALGPTVSQARRCFPAKFASRGWIV